MWVQKLTLDFMCVRLFFILVIFVQSLLSYFLTVFSLCTHCSRGIRQLLFHCIIVQCTSLEFFSLSSDFLLYCLWFCFHTLVHAHKLWRGNSVPTEEKDAPFLALVDHKVKHAHSQTNLCHFYLRILRQAFLHHGKQPFCRMIFGYHIKNNSPGALI